MKLLKDATLAGVQSGHTILASSLLTLFPRAHTRNAGGHLRVAVTSEDMPAVIWPHAPVVSSDVASATVTVARQSAAQTRFWKGAKDMASYAYAANEAADYALETKLRVARLNHAINDALADEVVTPAEARAMVRYARQAVSAAEITLQAAQSTYDREVAVVSLLTVNPLNAHIRRKAAKAGMDLSEFDEVLATITPFPHDEPFDAA